MTNEEAREDAVNFFKAIGMVFGGFFVAGLLLCAFAPASAWKDADAEIAANLPSNDTTLEDILQRSRLARLEFLCEETHEFTTTLDELQRSRLAARLEYLLAN